MILRKLVTVALACTMLAGCAETKQALNFKHEELTGFLGDYSQLQKGSDGEALLRYVKPGVNFAQYQNVIIDPVTVWTSPGTSLASLPASGRQQLADRFYQHLVNETSTVITRTYTPGPGTLRIQVALTDADESRPVLDTVSTVLPAGLAASTVAEVFTGQASFTGTTGMEIKVSDAQTGETLAAAVDKRVGQKSLNASSLNSWGDADASMKYWAQLLAFRICQYRNQANCVQPKA